MKKFWSKGAIVVVCTLMLFNCIQEVEVFEGSNPTLVIDGVITNEARPHNVRISYTTTFNTPPDFTKVEKAIVKIIDNEGNEELLSYKGNGVFTTAENFSGQVGKSYHVQVVLESDQVFESVPELLLNVAPIERIHHKLVGNDVVYMVDFTDPAGANNYYRWRYKGLYEMISPVAYDVVTNFGALPPAKCFSGGVRPIMSKVWKCWVSEFDLQYLQISNDKLFDGREVKDVVITAQELSRKYDRGYQFEVQQYSMTEQAYKYWEALENQIGNTGSIFETTNYQIKGNIRSVSDPDFLVLGYFGASAVSKAQLDVFDFQGSFPPMECVMNNSGCYPERCLNCLSLGINSTNVKPESWPY